MFLAKYALFTEIGLANKVNLCNENPYKISYKDSKAKPEQLCLEQASHNKYCYLDFEACLAYDAILNKFLGFISFRESAKWYCEPALKFFGFEFTLACENIAKYIVKTYKWEYWGYCVFSKPEVCGQLYNIRGPILPEGSAAHVFWDYAIICFNKGVYLVSKTQQNRREANDQLNLEDYYMLKPEPCAIDNVINFFKTSDQTVFNLCFFRESTNNILYLWIMNYDKTFLGGYTAEFRQQKRLKLSSAKCRLFSWLILQHFRLHNLTHHSYLNMPSLHSVHL